VAPPRACPLRDVFSLPLGAIFPAAATPPTQASVGVDQTAQLQFLRQGLQPFRQLDRPRAHRGTWCSKFVRNICLFCR
jgi:hypothetical protein